MANDKPIPRPPAEARQPTVDVEEGIPFHNTDLGLPGPNPDKAEAAAPAAPEPRVEDLGARSFAGQNVANDAYQQQPEDQRGAGLGAGSSQNRDARHPAQSDGEVPEDDMD